MRNTIVALITLGFVLALTACQKPTTRAAATKPGPAWPGKITLTTEPAQPVSEHPTTFRVTVADAAGQPVTAATVTADLKMQTMDMGKNIVPLADKGNGVYEGTGQFNMAGPWNVIISTANGSTRGEQKFEIVAKKP